MMETIKKQILNLKQNQWNYYEDSELKIPFSSDDTNAHELFIQKYFDNAEKKSVFEGFTLKHDRVIHTTSVFFLGILFYYNTQIKNKFDKDSITIDNKSYKAFPLLWFLSSLFHDYGVTKENSVGKIDSLKKMEETFCIENHLLEKRENKVDKILFENIEKYFLYRLSQDKLDHGIVAGLSFYDKLERIRMEREAKNSKNIFSSELKPLYAQTASAIATHNIWMPTSKNIDKYRTFEMDSLIDDYKPISINNFPLLYLLGIVDTIDPIKAYKGCDPNYVLDNLLIDFSDNKIIIENKKGSFLDFSLITDNAKGFKGWLNIDICSGKQKLEITLH